MSANERFASAYDDLSNPRPRTSLPLRPRCYVRAQRTRLAHRRLEPRRNRAPRLRRGGGHQPVADNAHLPRVLGARRPHRLVTRVGGRRRDRRALELPLLRRDGEERRIELTFSPLPDPAATRPLLLAIARDVTARSRSEAALRAGAEKLRHPTLFAATAEGIAIATTASSWRSTPPSPR